MSLLLSSLLVSKSAPRWRARRMQLAEQTDNKRAHYLYFISEVHHHTSSLLKSALCVGRLAMQAPVWHSATGTAA